MHKILEKDLEIRRFEASDWNRLVPLLQNFNLRHDEETWDSFIYQGRGWTGGWIVLYKNQIVAGAFLRPAVLIEQWHTPYDFFMGGVFQIKPTAATPMLDHMFWDDPKHTINFLCVPRSYAYNKAINRYKCVDIGMDRDEYYAKLTRFKLNGPHN